MTSPNDPSLPPADEAQRPNDPPIFNLPPIVTWIVITNGLIHVGRMFLSDSAEIWLFRTLAYIPARYGVEGMAAQTPLASIVSPIGYSLLHADLMHLFMNMAFFMAFGSVVARRMGDLKFLLLYGLSALAGIGTLQLFNPISTAFVIGASGAVSGMVGAVAAIAFIDRPNRPPPPKPFHTKRSAGTFVLVWVGLTIVAGVLPGALLGITGRIAWESHLGGFLLGFFLMALLEAKSTPR